MCTNFIYCNVWIKITLPLKQTLESVQPARLEEFLQRYWFVAALAAVIIYSYTSPQHVVICWVCISLAGSREDSKALCVPKAFGVGGSGKRTEGRGEREGMWHGGRWGDFVSWERLLRSDYLGRTKCFCWWRVAVISGSWEIDGTHRALAYWSWPRHWQSMPWLPMRENQAKWAACESLPSPFCVCCRCSTPIGIICIDKLSSRMINNHQPQSLYVCLRVRVFKPLFICVCVYFFLFLLPFSLFKVRENLD